jgi:hypothetical protein
MKPTILLLIVILFTACVPVFALATSTPTITLTPTPSLPLEISALPVNQMDMADHTPIILQVMERTEMKGGQKIIYKEMPPLLYTD